MEQLLVLTTVILVADGIWLTATASGTRKMIAALQGQPLSIRALPAVIVYAIMIAAVWFFAVRPATSVQEAAVRGAALGFAMYGLYDLTNYATLAKYPLWFALTDIVWGTFLFTVAAATTVALTQV
jgi:uncharacterized membrane protein